MATFIVPPLERQPWPTLGPEVVALMEDALVFGPGDLRGEPYRVDDEDRALIYRMYEVYPRDHEMAGRRRFNRCAINRRKGTAKSEIAAALAAVELHPAGPVRCDGWRRQGSVWVPVGRPITDPYIPMVAYTEEQSDDLAYAALVAMLSEGPHQQLFDYSAERVVRVGGDGKAVSLAGSPSARDGARTTFSVKDETHRWDTERLRRAHTTMLNNLPKRIIADPWELEITTRPQPGAGSVAEDTENYARAMANAHQRDSKLFFYLREASDHHKLDTPAGRRDAITEATAPSKRAWTNYPSIEGLWQDPAADVSYLERVWCNRLVAGALRAYDPVLWKELGRKRAYTVPAGALITLGFDGSRTDDATALVGTEVASGYQWALSIWQRPAGLPQHVEWEVPEAEVDAMVRYAFEHYDVWRMNGDPPYWDTLMAKWVADFGEKRVVQWWWNRPKKQAELCRQYLIAMRQQELSHCAPGVHPDTGRPLEPLCAMFSSHVANAVRVATGYEDDDGPLWRIDKERPKSPKKIDALTASILSWEARTLAVAAGALKPAPKLEPMVEWR